MPGLVNRVMSGELNVKKYITHKMPFGDINEAFDILHKGECLRAVLYFNE